MVRRILITMVVALLVAVPVRAGNLQDRLASLIGIEPSEKALSAADVIPEQSKFTFWLLGTPTELDNPDAEISLRTGWLNDGTEFGVQFDAIGVHGDNDETFGLYGIMHLQSETILDYSYVGYAASILEDNISYGPVCGIETGGLIVEYRYRDFSGDSPLGNATDRHQVYAGIVIRF